MCYEKRNNVKTTKLPEKRVTQRDMKVSRESPLRRKDSQSPVGNNQHQVKKQLSTKVKNVVQYRNGKLESLLLPFLVSTSTFVPKSEVEEECDMGHHHSNNESQAIDPEAIEDVPVVFEEFGGSEDDEISPHFKGKLVVTNNNNNNNKRLSLLKRDKQQSPHPKLQEGDSFMNVMLHTVNCRDCENLACKKMRLVLGHFLTCRKFLMGRNNNNINEQREENKLKHQKEFDSDFHADKKCAICNQLIEVVLNHSASCNNQMGMCPVPMCDIFKNNNNNNLGGNGNKNNQNFVLI